MSWKRHFQSVSKDAKLRAAISANQGAGNTLSGTSNKFSSYLPEIYAGHPQRIERYAQYDLMDQDSEINAALDTIADFSTRTDETTGQLFNIIYHGEAQDSEVDILQTVLKQWMNLNQFKKRMWRIFRSTLKYGDQFFIRDPETLKWYWIDQSKVEKVFVNEADGKSPEQYVIRDLDLNLQTLTATPSNTQGQNIQGTGTNSLTNPAELNNWNNGGGSRNSRIDANGANQNVTAVDATHVVHFSLSEGLDANWPFGTSTLEPVFKVFKQKELLEDSILIYRVQRAPERRIFYVDVGGIQTHRVQAYLEKIKMEIHQRRIPSRTGGGTSIMDASYNPLSMLEDYFFAQTPEGRGSRVETLPGGDNLGQIDDLRFFNNKLIRGLRVPSSYLPTGPDDGTQSFNDGRVGTAYIQEYRFANYCQRLQQLMATVLDDEFKLFVKQRGYNIEAHSFELEFNPPQNFRQFSQIESDVAQISVFQPMSELKYISRRFALKRFLNLTDEEIIENERMWQEENPDKSAPDEDLGAAGTAPGLDSIGFNSETDDFDLDGDDGADEDFGDDSTGDASPISGDEGGGEEDNPL